MWGGGYGGIPAIVLVIMMVGFGPPWSDWGLDARAKVTKAASIGVSTTGVSVNDSSLMEIKVSYRDAAGREHDAAFRTLDEGLVQRATRHEPVEIDYDPSDPSVVRPHGGKRSLFNESGFGWVVWMLLLVFIVPGLGALGAGLRRQAKGRRLYRTGTAAPATVVKHTESASSENDVHLTIAHYEFDTPHGKHVGELKTLEPPAVGARIWVIYDPARPSFNVPA
jgi:hypothetical protein